MDVSVIVAVRDSASTLRQCIESVLMQEDCSLELIIVDGLSTDGTPSIIASFDDARITVIREADDGIYDAWNKALRIARGNWCAFLGSDDFYMSRDSLASLLAVGQNGRNESSQPTFVYGGVAMLGSVERVVHHGSPVDPIKHLRRGRMLPHQGALHARRTLIGIGGFDASYRVVGDRPAVLRLLQQQGGAARCDKVVVVARAGGVSTAVATRSLTRRELYRFLRSERGWIVATGLFGLRRLEHAAGWIIESIVVCALGPRRGARAFLRLRRLLRRPPRMSPLRGAQHRRPLSLQSIRDSSNGGR